MKLKCETNTPEVESEIESLVEERFGSVGYDVFFEHGQRLTRVVDDGCFRLLRLKEILQKLANLLVIIDDENS